MTYIRITATTLQVGWAGGNDGTGYVCVMMEVIEKVDMTKPTPSCLPARTQQPFWLPEIGKYIAKDRYQAIEKHLAHRNSHS